MGTTSTKRSAMVMTVVDEIKFPWRPVIILAMCMTVNSYTLANLYPYVGVMAKHLLGLPTMNEAGFYAGYVASSFTFGRLISGYFWGHVSDKIGRKTVLIISLLSIVVCSLAFGLSTNFTVAMTSRFILGLLNGMMTASRTMTQEICGHTHVLRGMTYVSTSRGAGVVIGTGIGGLLAQPALMYPTFFSPTGVFAKYPFLFPNLFGAVLAVLILPLVVVFLPETRFFDEQRHAMQEANSNASVEATLQKCPESKSSDEVGGHAGNDKSNKAYHRLERFADGKQSQSKRQDHYDATMTCSVTTSREETANGGRDGGTVDVESAEAQRVNSTGYRSMMNHGGDGEGHGSNSDACRGHAINEYGVGEENNALKAFDRDEDKGEFGLCEPNGLLSRTNVRLILVMVALVQTLAIGFDEIYPLWALSSPDSGGLGWNTSQIGLVLTISGGLQAVISVLFFPAIIKKVGMLTWQRSGCLVGILACMAAPCVRRFSWNATSLFIALTIISFLTNCSVATNMLPLTMASTGIVESQQRGKLGGLYMTAESLGRTLGPASFSNVFAWSIAPRPKLFVDFHFVFFLSAAVMGMVTVLGLYALTPKIFNKPAREETKRDVLTSVVVERNLRMPEKQPRSALASTEGALPAQVSDARESTRLLMK